MICIRLIVNLSSKSFDLAQGESATKANIIDLRVEAFLLSVEILTQVK